MRLTLADSTSVTDRRFADSIAFVMTLNPSRRDPEFRLSPGTSFPPLSRPN